MGIIQGVVCLFGLVVLHFLGGSRSPFRLNYFQSSTMISRNDFPDDFMFGAGSSAYQYEGAANEGGKGPSVWDTFTHQYPEKILDHSVGDMAIDFYHRYKEDIQMLKEVGMDAFRFSISWPRLLPKGKSSGGVNDEGVKFYNGVINELISKGIRPFVTLFHWDVPQTLEDEYGGFLNISIVEDYRDYVDLCFKLFGDRVKDWITINEPSRLSIFGYEQGVHAPGRCSSYAGNCFNGDSANEPYIVGHHQLLAHAAAAQLYRQNYQISQKGVIGIGLFSDWFKPKSTDPDLEASHRALDFELGWFLHPVVYGDYPPIMRSYVGGRLPKFTKEESNRLKQSADFIGINHYMSYYASSALSIRTTNLTYSTDSRVDLATEENGIPIGEPTPLSDLFICPSGIRDLTLYIKQKYNNPAIYITENGIAELNDSTLPLQEARNDSQRIQYFKEYLWFLQEAIKEGANVKGYFAWSFIDSFEWESGFSFRFGMTYVDYKDGLKRYPKNSAIWFNFFLKK